MKTPKNIQLQASFISKRRIRSLALSLPMILINLYLLQAKAEAQSIQPETGPTGTGTTVSTPAGQNGTFNIEGGTTSDKGKNLFHSFTQFGLLQNETALFKLSNSYSKIENILGRINGGDPSIINGLIKVSGGNNPNLFLMNPSGLIFGSKASLDVPGSFTATTATGIGFGSNGSLFFNAVGTPNYTSLTGAPTSFAFGGAQAGAIISTANLTVESGNLTLLGGTVVSTGSLSAPDGQITLASVPGTNLVRVSEANSLLSLEIQASGTSSTGSGLPIASLPELLTGIGQANATGLSLDNGQVVLTASNPANRVVAAGDVAVTGNLAPEGGAIEIQAANSVAVSTNLTTQGGAIALKANGDISTRDLNSSSNNDGGNINVTSETGKVETGNINAGSSDKNGDSGNVTINAGDVETVGPSSNIQTGSIDATGKNGGQVTLNASNDIVVTHINTEGKTEGGDIAITAGGYFRATGLIASSNNESCSDQRCSISASTTGNNGNNGGGISISHGGATFGVGSAYEDNDSGTAGKIATGNKKDPIFITGEQVTASPSQTPAPTPTA
ncbi:filamentous hemagglutinin N-terminal domain-containing protein, partial [Microcoleus sp. C2C3]